MGERVICRRGKDVTSTQISIATNLVFSLIPLASIIITSGPQVGSKWYKELAYRLTLIGDPFGAMLSALEQWYNVDKVYKALEVSCANKRCIEDCRVISSIAMVYANDVEYGDGNGNTRRDDISSKTVVDILSEDVNVDGVWLPILDNRNEQLFRRFTGHIRTHRYGHLGACLAAFMAIVAGMLSIPLDTWMLNLGDVAYVRDSFFILAFGWVMPLAMLMALRGVSATSEQVIEVMDKAEFLRRSDDAATLPVEQWTELDWKTYDEDNDKYVDAGGYRRRGLSITRTNVIEIRRPDRAEYSKVMICNGIALPARRIRIVEWENRGTSTGVYYRRDYTKRAYVIALFFTFIFPIASVMLAYLQCPRGVGCKTVTMIVLLVVWIVGAAVGIFHRRSSAYRLLSTRGNMVNEEGIRSGRSLIARVLDGPTRGALDLIGVIVVIAMIVIILLVTLGILERSKCTFNLGTNSCGLNHVPKVLCLLPVGCESDRNKLEINDICNAYDKTWICKDPNGVVMSKNCRDV